MDFQGVATRNRLAPHVFRACLTRVNELAG